MRRTQGRNNGGFVERNPAELLFTPQTARRSAKRVAAVEEMARAFALVDLRARLILKLAGIAGMRPRGNLRPEVGQSRPPYAEIRQPVYRGDIDSPKSPKSTPRAALGEGLVSEVTRWRALSVTTVPGAWVFLSENWETPLRQGNVWRRHIGPKLRAPGLGWINFQVLRRSCSSLMNDEGIDRR